MKDFFCLKNTPFDTVNHNVLKINEVAKTSGLSTGLFRDKNLKKKERKKSIRGKQNSVSGLRQNVNRKERLFFLEQRINICA